jgi:hypothetical protein
MSTEVEACMLASQNLRPQMFRCVSLKDSSLRDIIAYVSLGGLGFSRRSGRAYGVVRAIVRLRSP